MNSKKFFEKAVNLGINPAELNFSSSKSFSFQLFKGELVSYSFDNSTGVSARGIYNGKMGYCSSENQSNDSIDFLLQGVIDSASLMESEDEPIIFKGSKSYKKKNVYSKELESWSVEDKIKLAHEIEDKLLAADSRISDVEVYFGESSDSVEKVNSYGLNLKNKTNDFYFYASIVIKSGEEIKSNANIYFGNNPKDFKVDEFVSKLVKEGLEKLNGITIKAGKYKAVLNQDTSASLLRALLSNLSSESVQKHTSLFEGKLDQKVLSSKLTVWEKPLEKNMFYSYFDYEGVAKFNKVVIDKGVIKTFFYNLGNAKKDGVESTGNATGNGSKVGIGFGNIFVRPGKSSQDELFAKIGEGVFITDISGLHAGLNPISGDFSLQAEGFHVKDGKKAEALTLFTVSGNLFKLFDNIIALGDDVKTLNSGFTIPSIAFRGLKISAE